jgi:serine phosphatase RsbU (regulator of sigma subunit)
MVLVYRDRRRFARHFPDLAAQLPARNDAAWLAVPLLAGSDVLGELGITWVGEGPSGVAREFLTTLATITAQSLRSIGDTAREHEVAARLQRSLLPRLTPIAGLDIAYRYEPAGTETLAGGDFYDVVDLGPELAAVVIGDVAGHGVEAAAASGEVRNLVRGVLEHTRDPGKVIRLVDDALGRVRRPDTMVTLLCALLDSRAGVLTLASAGHCPPVVRRADGTVEIGAVDPAPPLGARLGVCDGTPSVSRVPFSRGDLVVLYTDGLVERRSVPFDDVLERVKVVVSAQEDPQALCSALAELAASSRDHTDDLALLVVRRRATDDASPGHGIGDD